LIPVGHVSVWVDVAPLVEPHKDPHDRARGVLVEREPLLVVVPGTPPPLELVDDQPAVLLPPPPHAFDEALAAKVSAAGPLLQQRALHLCLGGDAGVVGPDDPLRPPAPHPVIADQAVLN